MYEGATTSKTSQAQGSLADLDERRCRLCNAELRRTFIDLGASPLCESYLTKADLDRVEKAYPLHVRICEQCLLVQLPECVEPSEVFSHYAYFSSYSDSWVHHAKLYTDRVIERFGLGPRDLVIEAASNDGYLLQHFVKRGIPVLGIEPAANVAEAALERDVRTVVTFLGYETGKALRDEFGAASLVVANNVFAHVPDIIDFAAGLRALLADDGVLTLEFPHLLRLIEGRQFDTIYHEHFSYLSLLTASRALAAAGLQIFDVEELRSHGGSLRVFAQHEGGVRRVEQSVECLSATESQAGLHTVEGHEGFAGAVREVKLDLVEYLLGCARNGLVVAGYGAPGKGNTLLNHCGIGPDLLPFTVDRNPFKQGRYLPGSRIPIFPPSQLATAKPDRILVLPWNLKTEIARQLSYTRDWGARLVVPIPALEEF